MSFVQFILFNPRQEAALQMLPGSARITNKDVQALYPEVHAESHPPRPRRSGQPQRAAQAGREARLLLRAAQRLSARARA
jgi:hypothetical protein